MYAGIIQQCSKLRFLGMTGQTDHQDTATGGLAALWQAIAKLPQLKYLEYRDVAFPVTPEIELPPSVSLTKVVLRLVDATPAARSFFARSRLGTYWLSTRDATAHIAVDTNCGLVPWRDLRVLRLRAPATAAGYWDLIAALKHILQQVGSSKPRFCRSHKLGGPA